MDCRSIGLQNPHPMKPILLRGYIPRIVGISLILHLMVLFSQGQAVFNANFGNIHFLASNIVHKVGTDGSAAGNVTLYTNVITIGGQAIDCIVRTVAITNGSFQLPGSAAGGTIPFDYSSATGTGMSANQDRFFAPTFNFNSGGGSCDFEFEFILGGSYNNSTNSGTPVVLQNVRLNTYDIDGNGSINSNQFNEFGGFSSFTVSRSTNINNSYNAVSGLTKFVSNTTNNNAIVTDSIHRVQVEYGQISKLNIKVGSLGSGAAYFFLDFGNGLSWTGVTTSTPVLDLNTSTSGVDNQVTICGDAKRLTNGAGAGIINLTGSSGTVDELIISFSTASILNGNAEAFFPKGSNALASDSIKLGFSSSSSQNFTLSGVNFVVQKSVSGEISTLRFSKSSSTLTTAQTEMLLDSLHYVNTAQNPDLANRTFNVTVREGSFVTPNARFILTELCVLTVLPVRWIGLQVKANNKNQVFVNWQVSDEVNNMGYHVEMSYDGQAWIDLGYVPAKTTTNTEEEYDCTFIKKMTGLTYFRIKQLDIDGKFSYSWVKKLYMDAQDDLFIWPNPVSNSFNIMSRDSNAKIQVVNLGGKVAMTIPLKTGVNQVDVSNLTKGIYTVRYTMENGDPKMLRMIKQ